MSIPVRYIPKTLTRKDRISQHKNILRSRESYRKGKFFQRPKVNSFHSKPSRHILNAKRLYHIDHFAPNYELSKKTRCTVRALKKIVNKGEGAYYSSGSRPNQTAKSWGIARLASSVTGGNASVIDFDILEKGCAKNSLALKLAKRHPKQIRKTVKFRK
jgi:hypothetical protein